MAESETGRNAWHDRPMTSHVGSHDFDFLFGTWRVAHRRLTARLANGHVWEEFEGTCDARPILGGSANIDDNVIHIPTGTYPASSLRSFDPATNTWAIWWLDGRSPHQLDVPVIGQFTNGTGRFYANDTLNGQPIQVRFQWTDTDTKTPRWDQAFSPDNGANWELNWTMAFSPS
jgi:hypothetical protein